MSYNIDDSNIMRASDIINHSDCIIGVPLEQRGGEMLEQVNDLFNLMGMKIQMNAEARAHTAETFKNETRLHKTTPNVIYMKGPKDRLIMMTESVDQSFQNLPRDRRGIYGAMMLHPHERRGSNDKVPEPKTPLEQKYTIKTKLHDIPYVDETAHFTEQSIYDQQRKLMKDALGHGLKLRAQDLVIQNEANKQVSKSVAIIPPKARELKV